MDYAKKKLAGAVEYAKAKLARFAMNKILGKVSVLLGLLPVLPDPKNVMLHQPDLYALPF